MYLYFFQIEELLNIIDGNQRTAFGDFGEDFVTKIDKDILWRHGADFNQLHIKGTDTVFNNFNFGMLAESLKVSEVSMFSYDQLKDFVQKGKYIPQSAKEKSVVKNISSFSFNELAGYDNKEEIITEIIEGTKDKKTPRQIASNIGHKTGYWNLDELVYNYQSIADNVASAEEIKKRNGIKDPLVYKWVSKSGCSEHCIRLHLTRGLGSLPIVYKLSELQANGSNEQRKPSEWKITVNPNHRLCSCMLEEKPTGYIWNPNQQSFSTPDPEYTKNVTSKRALIRVWISGKEHYL